MNWGRFLLGAKRFQAYRKRFQVGLANGLQIYGQRAWGYSARIQNSLVSGVNTSKNGLKILSKRLGVTGVRAKDGLISSFYVFGHRAQIGSKHFLSYAGQFQKNFIFGFRLSRNTLYLLFRNSLAISLQASTRLSSDFKIIVSRILSGFISGLKFFQILGSQMQNGFVATIRVSSKGLARFSTEVSSGLKILASSILSGSITGLKFLQAVGHQVQDGFVVGIHSGMKSLAWLGAEVSFGFKSLSSGMLAGITSGLKFMQTLTGQMQDAFVAVIRVSINSLTWLGVHVSFSVKFLASSILSGSISGLKSLQAVVSQVQDGFVMGIHGGVKALTRLGAQVSSRLKILASSALSGSITGLKFLQAVGHQVQDGFVLGLRAGVKSLAWLGAEVSFGFKSLSSGMLAGITSGLKFLQTLTGQMQDAFVAAIRVSINSLTWLGVHVSFSVKFLASSILSGSISGLKSLQAVSSQVQDTFVVGIRAGGKSLAQRGAQVLFSAKVLASSIVSGFTSGLTLVQVLGYRVQAGFVDGMRMSGKVSLSLLKWLATSSMAILNNILIGSRLLMIGCKYLYEYVSHVQAGFITILQTKFLTPHAYRMYAAIGGCITLYAMVHYGRDLAISITPHKNFDETASMVENGLNRDIIKTLGAQVEACLTATVQQVKQLEAKLVGQERIMQSDIAQNMGQITEKLKDLEAKLNMQEHVVDQRVADRLSKLDGTFRGELGVSIEMAAQTALQIKELEARVSEQNVFETVGKISDRIEDLNNKMCNELGTSAMMTAQTDRQVKELETKLSMQEQIIDQRIADNLNKFDGALRREIGDLVVAQTVEQIKDLEAKVNERAVDKNIFESIDKMANRIDNLDNKMCNELGSSIMMMTTQTAQQLKELETKLSIQKNSIDQQIITDVQKVGKELGVSVAMTALALRKIKALEEKMAGQEHVIRSDLGSSVETTLKQVKGLESKFDTCTTATIQQLKGLEEKLSAQNQAMVQNLSVYNERIDKLKAPNVVREKKVSGLKSKLGSTEKMQQENDNSDKVEQTIRAEVSEQLGLLRLKLKEQEKKQKNKKIFNRFLNQLVRDEGD